MTDQDREDDDMLEPTAEMQQEQERAGIAGEPQPFEVEPDEEESNLGSHPSQSTARPLGRN